MPTRTLWKGSISFGLINIPVGLFPATSERELQFTLLHKKDLSRIRYARFCTAENKEVPYSELVRGYEKNGRYVVLSEADLKKAQTEKSKTIDIITFSDENDIESIYYLKPYYIGPEKNSHKAYMLLLEALKESNKVAIVQFNLRGHSHLGTITPHGNVLVLNQLRFFDQIKKSSALELPKASKPTKAEMSMAMKLIEQSTGSFHAEKYKDAYVQGLEATIRRRKAQKGSEAPAAHHKKGTGKEEKGAKVYDLMTLLKASLEKQPVARTSSQKNKRAAAKKRIASIRKRPTAARKKRVASQKRAKRPASARRAAPSKRAAA
jgi:DNA end-binding protein Ku